jgi:hypothetical protein
VYYSIGFPNKYRKFAIAYAIAQFDLLIVTAQLRQINQKKVKTLLG